LIQSLIRFLLVADVGPDSFLVRPTVDEESSGQKMLPNEAVLALSIDPGQMDGALALDEFNNL